ncbi:hypothetical protein CERZMDRAFT_83935 [Cercospora zeae-maydis SCOH1-5]|uniref:Uncharacterized protein n=1 Tax=Cercospora zeae-maydis SCOH1-5 TaxID=717836 RepID=A0A6A6FHR4_9PEZI|nr:hypothetical protein CERZMDRAFT_83935 [Cercospora zeae-maydis SCOH1-5]
MPSSERHTSPFRRPTGFPPSTSTPIDHSVTNKSTWSPMSRNETSAFELSAPLSLSSGPNPHEHPLQDKKPNLERHISHIPQDSDLEDDTDDETPHDKSETSAGGIKSKLKRLKNRVMHHSHKDNHSHDNTSAIMATDKETAEPTEERHDSGNATSDFEITPGLGGVSSVSNSGGDYLHASSTEHKAITPNLERHISAIGPDGTLDPSQRQQQPKSHSPRMERHISGIPQDDYDSDREA